MNYFLSFFFSKFTSFFFLFLFKFRCTSLFLFKFRFTSFFFILFKFYFTSVFFSFFSLSFVPTFRVKGFVTRAATASVCSNKFLSFKNLQTLRIVRKYNSGIFLQIFQQPIDLFWFLPSLPNIVFTYQKLLYVLSD